MARPTDSPPSEAHERMADIYRRNLSFVWRNARRMGVPEACLEDVTQEVFVAAWRRLHDFEGRSKTETWLFGILMRVVRTHRRTDSRRVRKILALRDARECQGTSDPQLAYESRELLPTLLAKLDDDKRAIFVLKELEGFKAREIAAALDTNVHTINTRLRAARRQLRYAAIELGLDVDMCMDGAS